MHIHLPAQNSKLWCKYMQNFVWIPLQIIQPLVQNSSINLIIYYVMGRQFRQQSQSLFGSKFQMMLIVQTNYSIWCMNAIWHLKSMFEEDKKFIWIVHKLSNRSEMCGFKTWIFIVLFQLHSLSVAGMV